MGINPAHTQFGGHIRFKGSGQIEPRSVYGRLRGLDKVEREIACQIIHEESRTHGRIKRRVRASEHQAVAAEGAIGETQARSPIVAVREDQSALPCAIQSQLVGPLASRDNDFPVQGRFKQKGKEARNVVAHRPVRGGVVVAEPRVEAEVRTDLPLVADKQIP